MEVEFITYKDFFESIKKYEGYTAQYSERGVTIYYDFSEKNKTKAGVNIVQEPVFSIDVYNSNEIITPYGFRLTHMKKMNDFDAVERLAIKLSRTPIYMRE